MVDQSILYAFDSARIDHVTCCDLLVWVTRGLPKSLINLLGNLGTWLITLAFNPDLGRSCD